MLDVPGGTEPAKTDTAPGGPDPTRSHLAVNKGLTRDQLQAAFDATTDGVVVHGENGAILANNEAAERILGLTAEQLAGRTSIDPRWQSIHPDGSPFPGETHPAMIALRTKQPVHDVVMGVRKPSGNLTWIRIHATPLSPSGNVLVTFSDITRQKQIEEHLHFQAQLLRAVGQSVYATDLLGRITYLNPAAEALYGWKEEEVLGKSILDVAVAATKHNEAASIIQRVQHGEVWRGEFTLRRKDGQIIQTEVVGTPVLNSSGTTVGLLGVSQDISHRKEAEAALRDSEHLLRSIADGVPICILRWSKDLRLVFLNRAAKERYGRSYERMIGQTYLELMGEEMFQQHQPILEAALHGVPQSFEYSRPIGGMDHEHTWVQYVPHVIDGEVTGILVLESDITHLKRGELLRTQLSELVESASDAILRIGLNGLVQSWNPAAERVFGYSAAEMLGAPFWSLVPEEARHISQAKFLRVGHGERIEHYETTRVRKDGTLIEVSLTLSPIRNDAGEIVAVSCIMHDIGQRKALERQLQHARRLEVIGKLAGGVAHDFNNILQIMMLHLEHLERRQDLPESVLPSIRQLGHLTDRAAKVTSQLLMFARKQTVQLQTLDLNSVVSQIVELLLRTLGEHIELRTDPAPGPLWIEADGSMLEQVIVNLCLNARDAMPHGGTLRISTSLDAWNGAAHAQFRETQPGEYVVLSVSDSGCGMSKEVLSHLFEPFFTTKETGKGTGLGLAAVYGIVQQHRGFITVDSEPGKGSTFHVYFPWSNKVPHPQPKSPPPPLSAVPSARTLLLVEDEVLLRQIGVEMLKAEGFHVLAAEEGRDALRLFDLHADEIDLVISDMVMPGGITGMQLATQLRSRKPTLPIILMSGYSEEIISAESNPQAATEFIAKPFRYPDLVELIRRSLSPA